jgi:transcriptional regulator of met regulon
MSELDESQEALRNVEKITDSEPVNGEELLGSEDLRRQLREAKERLASESANKPRQ